MHIKCPVVGIDVGKDFCYFALLSPDSKTYIKPTKTMNDVSGWEDMIIKFKKAEEVFEDKPVVLLESTGHYSENFIHFFIRNDYKVFLINPLQSHSIKSSGIRKAKTDKLDCVDIAKLYFIIDLKEYIKPDEYMYNLKLLTRTYFRYSEEKTVVINQLSAALDQAMPGFTKIFNDISGKTSIDILIKYSSPDALLKADRGELIKHIRSTARKSLNNAIEKYEMLIACANDAKKIGISSKALFQIIKFYAEELKHRGEQLNYLQQEINQLSINIPSVELLKSIPSIGEKMAPLIAAEIGDISRFHNVKQLIAYCGIDPSVKQSGNFIGSKNKLTKRGSPYLRWALYMAAVGSLKHKDCKYSNKVLYEYYEKKIQSKVKKQAIGAIMNKLVRIIFSVLKNNHKFVMITPEEQVELYKHSLRLSA